MSKLKVGEGEVIFFDMCQLRWARLRGTKDRIMRWPYNGYRRFLESHKNVVDKIYLDLNLDCFLPPDDSTSRARYHWQDLNPWLRTLLQMHSVWKHQGDTPLKLKVKP